MSTSEIKTKSKKRSGFKDSLKSNKVKVGKQLSTEEEIREKANEIYLQRIEHGEDGSAENDWIEAEKQLSDSNG